MFKRTILFDLDGALNTYDGKYDNTYIPPVRNGAYELIILKFGTKNNLSVNQSHIIRICLFQSRELRRQRQESARQGQITLPD